jgi:putative tryptophan/tyrosine transport system substrate-binding protein
MPIVTVMLHMDRGSDYRLWSWIHRMADNLLRTALAVIFAVITILFHFTPVDAASREVVVVQSAEIKPFSEAVEGFEETCGCVIREIITLSSESPDVAARIRSLRPDGVLAVGMESLSRLQSIKSIPIFYTMGSSMPKFFRSAQNVSGVNMLVSPEKYAESVLQVLPGVKRVGFIYNPANTGSFADKLTKALHSHSVTVIAKQAKSAGEAPRLLEDMKGKVDALLLLPDTTITTTEMVNVLLIHSFRNLVPVIAFSEKYVRLGALAAVTVSPRDLGAQTGEMARTRLLDSSDQRHSYGYSKKHVLIINTTIARKLNISIRESVLRKSIRVE